MRLFCKISRILHISRCLSYHAPLCRAPLLRDVRSSSSSSSSGRQLKRSIGTSVMYRPGLLQSQMLQTPSTLLTPLPIVLRVQLYSQKPTNVFTFNARMNMLRKRISFSGTPAGSGECEADKQRIVPCGIITPECKDDKHLKIVIVPLDLAGMDSESLKTTLESINMLRKYANEIDTFATSMIDDYHAMNTETAEAQQDVTAASPAPEPALPPTDELNFWETYTAAPLNAEVDAVAQASASDIASQKLPQEHQQQAATTGLSSASTEPSGNLCNVEWSQPPNSPSTPNIPQMPNTSPSVTPTTVPTQPAGLPLEEPKVAPQINAAAEQESEEKKHHEVNINVPANLEARLNEMAISSMKLSFEMDMTNIRDALMKREFEYEEKQAEESQDSTFSMQTKVELDGGYKPENTLPLLFNALITGQVDIDAEKLHLDQMSDSQVPEFHDNVTSLAANICSTALQKGFPADLNRQMLLGRAISSTESSDEDRCAKEQSDEKKGDEDRSKYIKCVGTEKKGCVSPGNAHLPKYEPSEEHTKCDSSSNVGNAMRVSAQSRMALKRSQAMKHMKNEQARPKKIDEATMLSDNSTMKYDPKSRTMATAAVPQIYETEFEGPQLRDGCKHPVIKPKKKCPGKCPLLDDPCKEDPCKRPDEQKPKDKPRKRKAEKTVEITCSDKKSDCGKDKKKDPCAKKDDKKKKDPCDKFKKKDDKKKKDPCAKKDDKKKKDPCDKFKKKDDKKKKDPCAKKDDKKKKDPCDKFKKKKEDPCAKKKEDPCAKKKDDKKKDPCAKKDDKKKDPCAKKDDKKKKDPCDKFKKKKEDPCAKKKEDPCAKKKEDPCAKKKDDKKKKDPCAKFKKDKKKDDKCGDKKKKDPCAKFKKDKKKDDKCGDKKKKDPCAKFKKDKKKDDKCGDKKKKDPCAKFKKDKKKDDKCGDKKKKDPCAKFKKDKKKDDKCGDKKKKDPCAKFNKDKKEDPCKKKYSTYASHTFKAGVNNLKHLRGPRFPVYSTRLRRHYVDMVSKTPRRLSCHLADLRKMVKMQRPRFVVYSTRVRRQYSSEKEKDELDPTGKCRALEQKRPLRRGKDKKARSELRTDCFEDDECPKSFCSGACGPVPKRRKKCEPVKKTKNKKRHAKKKAKKTQWDKKKEQICGKPKKKSKKNDQGRGERNKLLGVDPSAVCQIQIRSYSDSCQEHNRCMSKACACTEVEKKDVSECTQLKEATEVLRIPECYKICKVQVPRPCPKDFDVLIRTGSIAISGSDIHVYENGNKDVDGMSLGHDATGFIEDVGRCVHHLRRGDRVVMESALSCGICEFCKQGLYNMCGGLIYNGFMATHQAHPADLCHRLPDQISMEEGALTQTLAMGCQACFKANITPLSNVLIIGSCPTAVAAAMCSQAIGAKRVAIAGTVCSMLDTVKQDFGFESVHFDSNALFGEVLEAIYSKFKDWPNCVINCAISAMTMNLAVMALQPCGVCVLAECESECASFNALDILMKNIRLIPSFRSTNMFPTALQLMKSGRAPMHKFIANTFKWIAAEEAFRCAQHESNVGLRKIIINSADEGDIAKLYKTMGKC
ncbi:titin homolog isoform X2 [Scaptodrosophila lebanonensis]|uniref:Titin homolog isoform X2 n=1 Tax=Drosophila lebanonensis TaxID=7225 RepID=A0A6J2T9K2_DROLE|nr:titin homolog isoform X2 [Scaptodrosophila lebanonensis]